MPGSARWRQQPSRILLYRRWWCLEHLTPGAAYSMTVTDWLSAPVRAGASDRKLQAGQTLFRAGQKTVGLYEVAEGKVRLVRVDRSGKEAILQLASAGDTLAEASLFSSTYHCDAIATTEAVVRLYPKAILLSELERDPELLKAFTAMLAQQVMMLRTRLERRNIHSARDRVQAFSHHQCREGRPHGVAAGNAQGTRIGPRAHARSTVPNACSHGGQWRDRALAGPHQAFAPDMISSVGPAVSERAQQRLGTLVDQRRR